MITHGGDVWESGEALGIPASEILDFSANINPRGLPPRARQRLSRDAADYRLLSFYPDRSARGLRRTLGDYLGVPPEAIVVGSGAEALLAPVVRSIRSRSMLVPVPAFSEYRHVCEENEVRFVPFPLSRNDLFRVPVDTLCRQIESTRFDAILLNNPHNPSGSMLDAGEMLQMADTAAAARATLVVDEAFIDYAPRHSLAQEAAIRPGLIAIRSLTKFFGCPALRVGYAIAHPDTIRRIQALLPTWPVTQLALDALAEAVGDCEYAEVSRQENEMERACLADSLNSLGIFVFPAAANYLFLELPPDLPHSCELRERLLATHRILIRNCDSYEELTAGRYIRIAVRTRDENRRLVEALGEVVRGR